MSNNIVEVKDLKVYFKIRQGFIKDIFSKKKSMLKLLMELI